MSNKKLPPLSERATMDQGTEYEPTRIIYYSHPKVGKTRAAAHATLVSDRVLWLEAEPGVKRAAFNQWSQIDQSKIIRIRPPELTFSRLEDLFGQVADDIEDNGTKWAVVPDTVTNLQLLLLTQTVDAEVKANQNRKSAPTKPELSDYGTNTEEMRRLMRQLTDMACHTIITAHVKEQTELVPGTKNKVGTGEIIPAMTDKFGESLFGLVDVVMYLDIVKGTRVGFLVPTSERRSGDRIGLMPVLMPEPSFDRVDAYMQGALTTDTDPIYRAFAAEHGSLISKENRRAGITDEPASTTTSPRRRRTTTTKKAETK